MGKQLGGSLFAVDDFRPFVRAWAEARGRGEFRRIARALKMHTTLVSQVFTGRKCLTEEQASRLCGYMGLNTLESDYFLKLIQIERAGEDSLKNIYRRHLKELRAQANEASSRVPESKRMSERDRAIFYSSWQYALVRLLTSNERFQTIEQVAAELELPSSRVREILEFLVAHGLCRQTQAGRYQRTEKNTHIEARSPLAIRHHQNWRAKSLELLEALETDDLAFTAPVSLSSKDFPKVHAILLDAISDIAKIVEKSGTDKTAYLGIDWIKM